MSFKLEEDNSLMAEINITPFVDVVLVLLIIFMITAPLMFNNIDLQLPQTKKVTKLDLKSDNIIISLNNIGELFIGKNKILWDELISVINSYMEKDNNLNRPVYIRADFKLPYGKVAQLLAYLKGHNITNVSLVTEQEKVE